MWCVDKARGRTHGFGGCEDVLDDHLSLLGQVLVPQRNLLVLVEVHVLLRGERQGLVIENSKIGPFSVEWMDNTDYSISSLGEKTG